MLFTFCISLRFFILFVFFFFSFIFHSFYSIYFDSHFVLCDLRLLQVVLCFSPVGSTLRRRSRKFPALVNCTAINFFNEWPKAALESVAKKFLLKVDVLPVSIEAKKKMNELLQCDDILFSGTFNGICCSVHGICSEQRQRSI